MSGPLILSAVVRNGDVHVVDYGYKVRRQKAASKGTIKWVGDGNAISAVHGMYQWWCQICALTAQLEHAREMVARIPFLEAQLIAAQQEDTKKPAAEKDE